MSFEFQTNRIHTGKPKSFSDLVSEYQKQKQVKTASNQNLVKTAEKDKDEAPSSGQLEVEPLHQKGESETPGDQKNDSNKKEEVSAKSQKTKKVAEGVQDTDNENNGDADDSEQPKWEGEKGNNNDPEAGKHRDGDGDQKKAKSDKQEKEANLDNLGDNKAKPFGSKDDDDDDDDADDADDKEASDDKDDDDDDEEEEEKKEASATKYIKTANLDEKSKTWLKEYWNGIYPEGFADAMTADK